MQIVSQRVVVRILLLLTVIAVAGEFASFNRQPEAPTWSLRCPACAF